MACEESGGKFPPTLINLDRKKSKEIRKDEKRENERKGKTKEKEKIEVKRK